MFICLDFRLSDSNLMHSFPALQYTLTLPGVATILQQYTPAPPPPPLSLVWLPLICNVHLPPPPLLPLCGWTVM